MKEQFIKIGYHITTDPSFQNEHYGITPELSKRMDVLIMECQENSSPKLIDKLHQLILKHPGVPQLKNYLATAFQMQGNRAKAIEVTEWTLKEHPDYLFGKITSANVCIENGEFDKVPDLLGKNLELQNLFPDRDLFHLGEVTNYFKIVIRYLAAMENITLAENRLSLLKEIAPGHPDSEQAETFLWPLRMKVAGIRQEEENKSRIKPVVQKNTPEISNQGLPQFHHPEIQYLYEYELTIPHEKLREILALPRQTLIEDLEKILTDAVNRYDYFHEGDHPMEILSFPLHALFLLMELKAESSLPKILSFLEHDYDFLNFWLGDHQTVTLWQCIYSLGARTDTLKEFLLKPGVDTYVKSAVSEALKQQVLHNTEKREEVLRIYTEVLNHFANAHEDDNIIDSDLIGFLIGDIFDCNLHELKPIIKILYDKGYVSLGINGDYNKVEKLFEKSIRRHVKKELQNIFELYTDVASTWAGYTKDKEKNDTYSDSPSLPFHQQPAVSDKVGRNDPCPCGSGKKYKKCCMDKDNEL